MVATYLIAVNLIDAPRAWRNAAIGFLALGVAESAYGLLTMVLYRLGVDVGMQLHRHIPIPIPYGTLQEGNHYGGHAASWALAFLWATLARWHCRERGWAIAGLVVTLAATLLSFARGAWLAFGNSARWLIAFIFYGQNLRGRWQRLAITLVLVPFALALLVSLALAVSPDFPLIGRLRTFGQYSRHRCHVRRGRGVNDYALAVADWQQHPWLGWGPGRVLPASRHAPV